MIHQLERTKNSSTIANKLKQRRAAAHRRQLPPQHPIAASGLASLHQIIDFSTSSLTVLRRRRSLSECVDNQLSQLPSDHKKVLIFNQRCPDCKENQLDDLKAFKSLLNTKSKTPKKVIVVNAYRKLPNSIRYAERQAHSLWELSSNPPSTEAFKQPKGEDFSLEPWNSQ